MNDVGQVNDIQSFKFINGSTIVKLDVTWSYVKRQTAKMTSEFVFFSSNPSLNRIQIENVSYSPQVQIFSLYCSKS